MRYIPKKLAFAGFLPLALTACGGNKTATVTPPPPPPAAATFESKFGSSFATAFDASNTADPADPTSSSVPPLDVTATPIDN